MGLRSAALIAVGFLVIAIATSAQQITPGASQNLPTSATVGGAYIYRVGGTDVAFADGGTGISTAADDTVIVSSGSAWQAKAVADCDDSAGNHLNYDTGTNAFSCGTAANITGVASGYKVARAETALDGGNPTSVASGLTAIVSCTVTLKGTAAPGVGTSILTVNINGTNLDVYAWKVTSALDSTLIASTGTESFYTICIGT